MATDQSTLDKITGWASDKYTSAAPSLSGATAPAAAAPAPASGLLSAAAGASGTPSADVNSWYRSTLGRDGDAGGISFWENALKTSGATPEQLYADFQKGANLNHENVKASSWTDANNYKGALSSNGSTSVDEWGRNVLGRDLTDAETKQWSGALSGATSADAARKVYSDFLSANAGGIKNSMDMNAASQLGGLQAPGINPTTIGKDQLAVRSINPANETVNGQLQTIMAADSPLLQQARADGMRTAFDRGMGNSSIAASAGEDSLLRAALQVATPDAAAYGKAADYNTAAQNQLLMWNGDNANQFAMADKNNNAAAVNTDKQLASSNAQQQAQLAQQMTVAQMQDQTTRWQQEQQTANSRYNTDINYKQQVDNQKLGVANNIIANMDMSPDRKAAMLEQLGYGTSAKPGVPGTGLAGAVYVIDSVGADLGGSSSVFQQTANQAISDADKAAWATGHTNAAPLSSNPNNTSASWGTDSPGYG